MIAETIASLPSGERELLRLLPGVADETDKSRYTTANVHLEKSFKSAPQRRLSWDADYVAIEAKRGVTLLPELDA